MEHGRMNKGNAVLVTGGSRGIGAAICRVFAGRGWFVCLTYRREAQRAEQVLVELRAAGGEGMAVQCDVQEEQNVLALFRRLDDEGRSIKALINNAGVTGEKTQGGRCIIYQKWY